MAVIHNEIEELRELCEAQGQKMLPFLKELGYTDIPIGDAMTKEGRSKERDRARQIIQELKAMGYKEAEESQPQPEKKVYQQKTPSRVRAGEQRKRYNNPGALGYGEDEDDEVFHG